jgi:hypothetical protein
LHDAREVRVAVPSDRDVGTGRADGAHVVGAVAGDGDGSAVGTDAAAMLGAVEARGGYYACVCHRLGSPSHT